MARRDGVSAAVVSAFGILKLLTVSMVSIGCSDNDSVMANISTAAGVDAGGDAGPSFEDDDAQPLRAKAGFIHLPPRRIRIVRDVAYEGWTTETMMFYSFWPAEIDPEVMPLFVVFNGGPSVATSSNLAAFGVGPNAVDYTGDGNVKENPNSFTEIGNLLFVDTRQVGFSYGRLPQPEVSRARSEAYSYINFSIFADAGDILLTVLSFLKKNPEIQHNAVVIIAESYGGARAAMIANYLNRPSALSTAGGFVEDRTLAGALAAHFEAVMPQIPFAALSVNETKQQFGWQILLQPGLMLAPVEPYYHATCRRLAEGDEREAFCAVAAETHDLRARDVLDGVLAAGHAAVMDPTVFTRLFGVRPETIEGLAAQERFGAFRHATVSEQMLFPSWFEKMGVLPDHDTYHLPELRTGLTSFAFPTAEVNTEAFIESLAHLNVFISNAYYDGIIASDGIPEALVQANERMAHPMITSIYLDNAPREGIARPGWMKIVFEKSMRLGVLPERTVRMPQYKNAGHMITLTQSDALREDIHSFLMERGAYL